MKKLILAGLVLLSLAAKAEFPDKPIRMIVPFPAGTVTDLVGRKLANEMGKELHQTLIVENKPGAFGVVGAQTLLSSPADGYNLMLVGVTSAASNVSLMKKLPFDPVRDFSAIGMVADFPFYLVARPGLPVDNIADVIAYSRKHPGKLSFASGAASAQVAVAQLATKLGIQVEPVPYLSAAKALTDVMGDRVDLLMGDMAVSLPQARAGKVRSLGVSSRERSPLAPEVPTLQEAGAADYEMVVWFGLVTNADVPQPVVAKLSEALARSLKNDSLIKTFNANGLVPRTSSATEFGAFIRSEVTRWARMVKDAGIEPQ